MKLYAGPLVRDTRFTNRIRRRPPTGVQWMLNMSTLAELGSANNNDGLFLFAVPDARTLPAGNTLLMSGITDASAVPSASERTAILTALRIPGTPPAGVSVGRIILHALINGDPDATTRMRCAQPDRDNWTFVGPGGQVITKPFDFNDAESANFKTLLQNQYRALKADVDAGRIASDIPAKWLGAIDEKYGRNDSETWAVPSDLRAGATKRQPTTSISDDFNRANSSGFGTGTTFVLGSSSVAGVSSNTAAITDNSTAFNSAEVRYDSALSSSDHHAQVDIAALTNLGLAGVFARMDNGGTGAFAGYCWQYFIGFGSTGTGNVNSWISGVENQITADVTEVPSVSDTLLLDVSGSTITAKRAGVTKFSFTDTAVTSGFRAGFRLLVNDGAGNAGAAAIDNFSADDGLTTGAALRRLALINGFAPRFEIGRRGVTFI